MVGADAGDRFPQWGIEETKEFLGIRSELDRSFMETKRNKLLWEVISTRMRDKGFYRSAEQCKCKWKNLFSRYKGCETMEAEAMRQQQFPLYNEMQAIFSTRVQTMMWAEAEGTSSRKKKQPLMSSSDDEAQEDSEGEKGGGRGRNKGKRAKIMAAAAAGGGIINVVMKELMGQQVQMEVQWREAYEARAEERRRAEVEWRQRMETLEEERVEMERRWREREEHRWLREEARAEKRDVLITALLNKLITRQTPNM